MSTCWYARAAASARKRNFEASIRQADSSYRASYPQIWLSLPSSKACGSNSRSERSRLMAAQRALRCCQVPMMPPSRRRIATVAERGRPPAFPLGQELTAIGFFGSLRGGCSKGSSPGCWMLMKRVRWSGVSITPVISQPRGPTKNRRISPVPGSAASIWLLPMPVQSSVAMFLAALSV
jgi:hypothetical protein